MHKASLLLKNPVLVVLLVSLVLLSINILYIGRIRPFNSDDLYWQLVIRDWRPFSGDTFYFGTKDIFVGLGPFFALFEQIFTPSRRLIIFETLLLTVFTFAATYAFGLYLLRKLKVRPTYIVLSPFVWLASFGYPMVQNYLNTNWRTYQLGFAFLTYMFILSIINKDLEIQKSFRLKMLWLFAILTNAVLIYGDPYYLFFTIGPITVLFLFLVLSRRISRSAFVYTLGFLGGSAVLSGILSHLAYKADIYVVMSTPSQFIGFDGVVSNILSSLHGLFILFGADFLGREAADVATLGMMINAVLVMIILFALFKFCNFARLQAGLRYPGTVLLVITMLAILVVYTSSTLVAATNFRFFILFAYCSIIFLSVVLAQTKDVRIRKVVVSVITASVLFNLCFTVFGSSTKGAAEVRDNRSNWLNFALIENLEKLKQSKGYSSFWQANVNSYLSEDRITLLPAICMPDGITAQFRWLINEDRFNRESKESFFLIDPHFSQPATCDEAQMEKQFGAPKRIEEFYDKKILIYDYDISSRMTSHINR